MHGIPQFEVPAGAAATVKIIDTTSSLNLVPLGRLLEPPVHNVNHVPFLPVYSYYIESSDGRKVLFDLGTRKDMHNLSPSVYNRLPTTGWELRVEKNVIEILEESGYQGSNFEAIIWSHQHWDHIGDPSTFPDSVKLVVGPGFKDAYLPGYPERADSPILETDYRGREMIEIDFSESHTLTLGRLPAHDYFGDGSFYLLNCPGHAIGHLSALVRTSTNPDTFILLAADAVHDMGEIRPSEYLPLPKEIDLHHYGYPAPCPGHLVEMFQDSRGREPMQPLFIPSTAESLSTARATISKLQEADCQDNILAICGHDNALAEVIDLFPKSANHWKAKGWSGRIHWAFLRFYIPAFLSGGRG
ncbi:beta-lactamase-like protein [Aspergillus cavernicola]|uniref:Beta-lactamase-like protein n=1 Tax=Aspergillus cavernicola TaxID=176166 RepID=A0ABR4J2W5_9EURO